MQDQIIYEDNHLIAVNKNPSQIVQGDKTGDLSLDQEIKDYMKQAYNKPGDVFLGVIHRLDRPVSGVIVYARTSKALSRMNEMFREGQVEKVYWAIVKNHPDITEGELSHYLKKNEKQNKSYAYDKPTSGAKHARLAYRMISRSDNYTLLEVNLETGRHHQIRCQLSKMGWQVKGDLKYGFPRSNPDASISLHARKLVFTHPVKKERMEIVADPPADNLWKALTESL
ncbi:MAG: RluA family pseudouridine synthase [Bacteroidales bacterium]|nr:RluA family pseudouridine synthase [Bacteroidales bacterium]